MKPSNVNNSGRNSRDRSLSLEERELDEEEDVDLEVTKIKEAPKGADHTRKKNTAKQPTNPDKVKRYLLNHPEFMDAYVNSSVELQRLRDWLNNKGIRESQTDVASADAAPGADCCCFNSAPECPNASLLDHFKRGQDAFRNVGPHCCTCTQLPPGPKSKYPYIIYALDENDSSGNHQQNFTVPRPMTINEMAAFSRRYGFDLCRRMNIY